MPELAEGLFGRPLGDEGYVSGPLREALYGGGVQLVPKLERGMPNRLVPLPGKIMLRKRAITESVVDRLKNISLIGHSRHRSVADCFVNLVAGRAAHTWREKKPGLNARVTERSRLPAPVF